MKNIVKNLSLSALFVVSANTFVSAESVDSVKEEAEENDGVSPIEEINEGITNFNFYGINQCQFLQIPSHRSFFE
ncbi:hypothetical protein C518_1109 [Lysinibacillus fusiformis ZB2]|nr:hypothetical protein C518_1109 [Lysinibacillus fusiformis ZB2]